MARTSSVIGAADIPNLYDCRVARWWTERKRKEVGWWEAMIK